MTNRLHDHAMLYEMIRCYVCVAETLNLTEAAKQLKVTRPTVRRYLNDLQDLLGTKLLVLEGRQYRLSEDGVNCLEAARITLEQISSFSSGRFRHLSSPGQFEAIRQLDRKGEENMSQRHGLAQLWRTGPQLLRQGLQVWTQAEFDLGHPAMKPLLPYLLVYRRVANAWMCVAIGEQSSFMTLLGEDWGQSSIGVFLHEDAMAAKFDRFMAQTYSSAYIDGAPRLDHVYAHVQRKKDGPSVPIAYQRLLLPSTFPNKEPALAVLVARTKQVEIEGVTPAYLKVLDKALLMDHVSLDSDPQP